ncbi:N-lysine methyltransferase KMT5A-A-like [Octopus sinensis]|uniref:[histone H4]-lysine(20) N-methyltransferase n=2 Tax=Octopus TaxID=6643 RepID=A0A6P7SVE3_9MOLL|nr:N-lysine methyltransferase KMT5A-A-like [Octopus sinensis]
MPIRRNIENGECQPNQEHTPPSALLTPDSSPSSSIASYEKPDLYTIDPGNPTNTENGNTHNPLLLLKSPSNKPSRKKKGRTKKRRVVSTHRNSLSPKQKPKTSTRQKKNDNNNNVQGQTSVTDYFPVRRSNRQTKKFLEWKRYQDIESAVLNRTEDGLKVVDFNGKGRGVIATRSFKKGEFVVEYAGDLISYPAAKDRERIYASDPGFGCYMYYFVYNSKNYCVDATDESGRLGRLINHSRSGNCRTKLIGIKGRPYLILVASRNINNGEELLYDYGDRSKASIAAHPWLRD